MPNALDPTFSEILDGCRRKDRESQNRLYRLFYAYGMSVSIRYVNNESEALSILNDSFLKVFRHIKRYDPERPFKTWFRTILVHTALNHLRKNKKHSMHLSIDEAHETRIREDILSRISYNELVSMVQSLSTAYRTVFNLYVIDGYKHEEIANMLGISVGTSKSNLFKAREKLRQLVTESLGTRYA